MTVSYNLAAFTGLVAPAVEPNIVALNTEVAKVVFDTAVFATGLVQDATLPKSWDMVFTGPDPTDDDLTLLNDAIAAHTGKPLLARALRLRKGAEVTVSSSDFTSVLDSPFKPGPLSGGDWHLIASAELKLDTVATWGASGPDKAVEIQVTRDGVELALDGSPFATYNTFAFTAGAEHVGGDDPVFDILIRRLGGSGDVKARRMKLEVVPVTSGAVEEQ